MFSLFKGERYVFNLDVPSKPDKGRPSFHRYPQLNMACPGCTELEAWLWSLPQLPHPLRIALWPLHKQRQRFPLAQSNCSSLLQVFKKKKNPCWQIKGKNCKEQFCGEISLITGYYDFQISFRGYAAKQFEDSKYRKQ